MSTVSVESEEVTVVINCNIDKDLDSSKYTVC